MSHPKTNQTLKTDQAGLVAIVVTLMILVVITLITVTFSQIIRREQRQALDRQLNTQAFYAAESGINDAVEALNDGYRTPKDACGPLTGGADPLSLKDNQVDEAHDVAYTCLTIDPEPLSLEFDDIDVSQSTVIPLKPDNPISSITVAWQAKDGVQNYDCGALAIENSFPPDDPDNPPCGTGLLRLEVVPAASLNRDVLVNGSRTLFLIPAESGVTEVPSYPTHSGEKVAVKCDADQPKVCQLKLNVPSGDLYYLRVKSLYKNSSLTVTAHEGSNQRRLRGVQAIVDSTGKASDVLRRVQVRVPLGESLVIPDYTLQSTDTICKRLSITGTNTTVDLTDVPIGDDSPDTTPCNL